MRILTLAILAIGTFAAASPGAAQTYAPGYPVCLHVYGPVSYYDCRYSSLAQCSAAASGRSGQCVTNPYAANAQEPMARPYRQRRYY